MFKRGLVAAIAAAGLVSAPALAQSASKLSVAGARANAGVSGEKLEGNGALIGIAAFVAAVAIIYFVAEGNDESESN